MGSQAWAASHVHLPAFLQTPAFSCRRTPCETQESSVVCVCAWAGGEGKIWEARSQAGVGITLFPIFSAVSNVGNTYFSAHLARELCGAAELVALSQCASPIRRRGSTSAV